MSMWMMAALAASLLSLDRTIVTPSWLEQQLDNPYVVVVEIGSGQAGDRPHIPGARFVDIESIVARDGWPPDELPPVDQLRKAFGNAGVGDDGRIILYSSQPLYATRAWFTLDYLGQADRTAILDGGFQRWTAEKRPVSRRRIQQVSKTFTPFPVYSRVIEHDAMRNAVNTGAVLLDARSPLEFNGLRRGQQVARRGHIPGAECHPWQANLMRSGAFRPLAHLRGIYSEVIGDPEARVIVYCRTGMEASMPYFILRSLGYDVALYDGSYAAWSRDPSAPVVNASYKP